jgi:hypothetical protein
MTTTKDDEKVPTASVADSQKAVKSTSSNSAKGSGSKPREQVVGQTEEGHESRYQEACLDPAVDDTFHVENFYDPNTGELIQGRLGDGTYVDNRKDK